MKRYNFRECGTKIDERIDIAQSHTLDEDVSVYIDIGLSWRRREHGFAFFRLMVQGTSNHSQLWLLTKTDQRAVTKRRKTS
ncbi:Hypothetical predicted protein [Octopus vulgaris]|uniref:Uncharacterized protein n=1 Tax=Octopus vulgaris TaxID=6645 RepID=A0AA36B7D7_OCTVU|nr:Hypothetical predicted protein [Octopus vulgaris]